jgi:DNA-binding NarL/FixJ family response regulator
MKRIVPSRTPWLPVATYGALLAAGTFVLQWLDFQRLARAQTIEVYVALVAGAFLVLGVVVGIRLAAPSPVAEPGNPQAVKTLGISPRELGVLHALAAGQSNKEIARTLGVSPNTVKTHLARLYDKLGAVRRTDAVARARELGLLP